MKPNYQEAYKILKRDKVLQVVIQQTGKFEPHRNKNLYDSLLSCVVSQQLSVKAADTIWGHVKNILPAGDTSPHHILAIDNQQYRQCGLSYAKADYLKNIARFALENSLDYRNLYRKSDAFLLDYLSSIKGIGRWSAEMILIFTLNRENIFPADDAAIQTIMKSMYRLQGKGKELKEDLTLIADKWSPYRSLACRHLWKYKDLFINQQ